MNFIESNNHVDRFLIESRSGDSNFALGQSWGQTIRGVNKYLVAKVDYDQHDRENKEDSKLFVPETF